MRNKFLLYMSVFLHFIASFYFGAKRHLSFNSYYFDLGVYARKMWLITQGQISEAMTGHLEPFLILISPIYKIFPSPITLLFIQSAAISGAAIVLFEFSKKRLNDWQSLIVSLTFLAYAPLLYTSFYDFHTVALGIIFVFLSFIFYDKKNFAGYSLSSILLILIREDVALTVIFMNLFHWFKSHDKKYVILSLISIIYFIGFLSTGPGTILTTTEEEPGRYSYLGNTPGEMVFNIIKNPFILFQKLNFGKVSYFVNLFAPLLFLPLLSQSIVVAIPALAINILSVNPSDYVITNHHSAMLIPVIFVSLVYTLEKLKRKNIFIYAIFFSTLLFSIWLFLAPNVDAAEKISGGVHADSIQLIINSLPEGNYSIAAEQHIYPHLTNRERLHVLPALLEFGKADDITYADYVILDEKIPKLDYYGTRDNLIEYINLYRNNNCFETIKESDGVILLKNIC